MTRPGPAGRASREVLEAIKNEAAGSNKEDPNRLNGRLLRIHILASRALGRLSPSGEGEEPEGADLGLHGRGFGRGDEPGSSPSG